MSQCFQNLCWPEIFCIPKAPQVDQRITAYSDLHGNARGPDVAPVTHKTPSTSARVCIMGLQFALWLWSQGQYRHVCMGSVCGRNAKFQMTILLLFLLLFNYFRKKTVFKHFVLCPCDTALTLGTLFAERQGVYQHSINSVHD